MLTEHSGLNYNFTTLQTAITKVLFLKLSLRKAPSRYKFSKSTVHVETSPLNRGGRSDVTTKDPTDYLSTTTSFSIIDVCG